MNSTDTKFITNEDGHKLIDRFNVLTKGTKFFDCLVGYFYTSGFYEMYKSFETTEKIRILIGISTDNKTFDLIQEAEHSNLQQQLGLSSKEAKIQFSEKVVEEMNNSKDSKNIEEGILKFIEWLKSKKLEIRVYPTGRIHAKLYIMTSNGGGFGDKGRVITGSSNFTQAGLKDNLEFNVELKDSRDYDYALNKFNELWDNSIDVSKEYVEIIKTNTWLNDEIPPYELFLKFLYEFLKDKIQLDQEEIRNEYKPENFMELEYQKDAVRDAKMKLEEYGGVFISDVVGLGKTFMTTMLAQQLDGGTLVLAPPILLDKNNPGSWKNAFFEFGVNKAEFESIGKLDQVLKRGTDKYRNVIIDEAHRFRTESTQMYEQLYKICRGKRVILVTATPLNNTPQDILALIKLFQNSHKSTLPNPKVRDLEKYFKGLQAKLKTLHRQNNKEEYLKVVKENAQDIRDNVLQYLMVRRTRTIIDKYYSKDLKKQKLVFPKVKEPEAVIYNFSDDVDDIFNKTLKLVVKDFKYSRYTPLLYLKEELPENQQTPQRNMGRWMKILLLKRLESSFYAFKKSISRFIYSYKRFLEEYEKGYVFISEKYTSKVFELLEDDDIDAVDKLIDAEKAKKEPADKFNKDFIEDLKSDVKILNEIEAMWRNVETDPKLEEFIKVLKKNKHLKKNKLIVFTESKETAEYLESKLNPIFSNQVLAYSSTSGESIRERIIENFDPASRIKKNDVRILVTTEILSEGVNLNRSNVVINYDIPWNPIRMMQRVGRINRVGKNLPFDEIYTYNLFPAGPINDQMGLTEAAEVKIQSFIEMLGADAKLLTDEEIKSHELFRRLNSKEIVTGEDATEDSELEWLLKLRDIRDTDSELFEKIKRLPKKSRTGRKKEGMFGLFTFFKKGKLRKLYYNNEGIINEIDFSEAVNLLCATKLDKKMKLNDDFYKLLEQNKKEFSDFFVKEVDAQNLGNRGHEGKIKAVIKAMIKKPIGLTDDDEEYLRSILNLIQNGSITKKTLQKLNDAIKKEDINPIKILAKIRVIIPEHSEFFKETYASFSGNIEGPKEVILSEMFIK
ncbi:MAG: helicase-related protein [Candidatus ainarchaeum sp.]|nr:helicase-related protein [Candidatus ainarchaeum sp.]